MANYFYYKMGKFCFKMSTSYKMDRLYNNGSNTLW